MRGFVSGTVVAVVVPAAGLVVAPAAPPPLTLRYRLETGDRFVYRQTLTREAEGQGSLSVVQAEWTSEVLVLARSRQGAVGIGPSGAHLVDVAPVYSRVVSTGVIGRLGFQVLTRRCQKVQAGPRLKWQWPRPAGVIHGDDVVTVAVNEEEGQASHASGRGQRQAELDVGTRRLQRDGSGEAVGPPVGV